MGKVIEFLSSLHILVEICEALLKYRILHSRTGQFFQLPPPHSYRQPMCLICHSPLSRRLFLKDTGTAVEFIIYAYLCFYCVSTKCHGQYCIIFMLFSNISLPFVKSALTALDSAQITCSLLSVSTYVKKILCDLLKDYNVMSKKVNAPRPSKTNHIDVYKTSNMKAKDIQWNISNLLSMKLLTFNNWHVRWIRSRHSLADRRGNDLDKLKTLITLRISLHKQLRPLK